MIVIDERDIAVIRRLLSCCYEIDEALERFGKSLDDFKRDNLFRNAVSMSLQQIGEFVKRLSDEFKVSHPDIPWRIIRGMRNWFAHDYYAMDIDTIWDTVVNDIPTLRKFCEDILNKQ